MEEYKLPEGFVEEEFDLFGIHFKKSEWFEVRKTKDNHCYTWDTVKKIQESSKWNMTPGEVYDIKNSLEKFWTPNPDYKHAHHGFCWYYKKEPPYYYRDDWDKQRDQRGYPWDHDDDVLIIDTINDHLIVRVIQSTSHHSNDKDWTLEEGYRVVLGPKAREFNFIEAGNIPRLSGYDTGQDNFGGKRVPWFGRCFYNGDWVYNKAVVYKDNNITYKLSTDPFKTSISLHYTWIYIRKLPSWCKSEEKLKEDLRKIYQLAPRVHPGFFWRTSNIAVLCVQNNPIDFVYDNLPNLRGFIYGDNNGDWRYLIRNVFESELSKPSKKFWTAKYKLVQNLSNNLVNPKIKSLIFQMLCSNDNSLLTINENLNPSILVILAKYYNDYLNSYKETKETSKEKDKEDTPEKKKFMFMCNILND